MNPPEDVQENPLYSGPMLDAVVKLLTVKDVVPRRKLRDVRQNLRLEVQRLQQKDLDDCDSYFKMLLSTTDCPMTIQMMGVIARQIRLAIQRSHKEINFDFKIIPQIERQQRYSDRLRTVNFGWTVTKFVNNDRVSEKIWYM